MHLQWHQQGHCYLKVQEVSQSEGYQGKRKNYAGSENHSTQLLGKKGGD
jgi:hypothetical protein